MSIRWDDGQTESGPQGGSVSDPSERWGRVSTTFEVALQQDDVQTHPPDVYVAVETSEDIENSGE